MAGKAKNVAGRPARTRVAESRATDGESRGQPKRRSEAEPLPLPAMEPVRGLIGRKQKFRYIAMQNNTGGV